MAATGGVNRDALRRTSAPALLCERARTTPGDVAFRSKHLGIYRERTFRDYAHRVSQAAQAFAALGLEKGERVAIMGDVCEEWLICDLAAQSLGAIVYGIYPTAAPAEVEYQVRDGGAVLFVAEDQEYVDKILPLIDGLPQVRAIVTIDESAMFGYDHPRLASYRALVERQAPDLDWLAARAAAIGPEDPAFIVYTSGTTGHPKGALVAHGKHLAAAASVADHYPTLYAKAHRTVVYLPLCHVLGRDVAVTLPLFTRLVPHFGEDPEDLATTLFETAPTVLFTVPRYLQKFAAQVLVAIAGSSKAKRLGYELAMRLARAHARIRWKGEAGLASKIAYRACHATVFRPILNKLGFDKLELVVSGGAPLPTETMALWHMYGVNVVQMYGQTEGAGGIVAGQCGPFPRPGSVGTAPEGWDVKLAPDGEVLVQSRDLFEGYWNDPAVTASFRTDDGYWRTGDIGEWRDGNLCVVDRARDFLVTAGGKTIAPATIENLLRASPYIAEAVAIGHGRKYIAALIEIDPDTVSSWARGNDVTYTSFTNLAEHPRVAALIAGEIDKANAGLARVEQVKTFRILPKMLAPEEENEPVTPTRKVKRAMMMERFKLLVDAMYDDSEGRMLAAEVRDALSA